MLLSTVVAGQEVKLVYAPETKQPSPLFQLKVNGTQRCQIKVYAWGRTLALQLALQLYTAYVEGRVSLDDIYSHRNNIEAQHEHLRIGPVATAAVATEKSVNAAAVRCAAEVAGATTEAKKQQKAEQSEYGLRSGKKTVIAAAGKRAEDKDAEEEFAEESEEEEEEDAEEELAEESEEEEEDE